MHTETYTHTHTHTCIHTYSKYFSTTGKPPIVFIHGSFHGSWCWAELWMPFFARNGFACYAMTLRGASATPQVGDAKNVQLAEHIADLTAFIQSVVPGSTAPILIGHSFGGMYAQASGIP